MEERCKKTPACLNFSGLAPASLSDQPEPAKSAIFGKIGGKTINLAGTFLHNGVQLSPHHSLCDVIVNLLGSRRIGAHRGGEAQVVAVQ